LLATQIATGRCASAGNLFSPLAPVKDPHHRNPIGNSPNFHHFFLFEILVFLFRILRSADCHRKLEGKSQFDGFRAGLKKLCGVVDFSYLLLRLLYTAEEKIL
jgi:hypothetical protein